MAHFIGMISAESHLNLCDMLKAMTVFKQSYSICCSNINWSFNPVSERGREETGRRGLSVFMFKDETVVNAELWSAAFLASLHVVNCCTLKAVTNMGYVKIEKI